MNTETLAQQEVLDVVKSRSMTHNQKVTALSVIAYNMVSGLEISQELQQMLDDKIICDLREGLSPLRPRYITPDYGLFLQTGCRFLKLNPPQNLAEALNHLLIFYRHVPSVTNFPVYLGNLDTLLEPFVKNTDRETAKTALRLFLMQIDRTITDSFCHANIGPQDTVTGRLLLEIELECCHTVPNISLKYDPDITPDDFALQAIQTQLIAAKPSFANDRMFRQEFGGEYAIASCYNGLYIGGGAYTLVRTLLGNLAKTADSIEDFIKRKLPHMVEVMLGYLDERVRFLVEECGFFKSSFLVEEGFVKRERFTGMFGIVGLAQCVNLLLEKEGKLGRFGTDSFADQLGVRIIETIDQCNRQHQNPYCEVSGGYFLLHGQVGISTDQGQTPNCRIPIGDEPAEMADHILHCGLFHKYFASGIGEIFMVEPTAQKNPSFVLDILKGAMKQDVRYLSIHASDSDLIRVTGYLAKKSEIARLSGGEADLYSTTVLALGQRDHSQIYQRKVRRAADETGSGE